jgi:hypothetical protein
VESLHRLQYAAGQSLGAFARPQKCSQFCGERSERLVIDESLIDHCRAAPWAARFFYSSEKQQYPRKAAAEWGSADVHGG